MQKITWKWDLDQWESYLELELFLKLLVVRELMNGADASQTLYWVIGCYNGWKDWVLTE